MKSFAGSIAALGVWLASWVVTLTINSMLQWSSTGTVLGLKYWFIVNL